MGYDLVVVAGVVFLLLVDRQQRIAHEGIFATVKANGGGEIGHIGDVKIQKCFRSDFCRQAKAVRRGMELMGGVGNNKGKATFKIKNLKKKGTYKAVIKFKGNKNYKATSKKVKIKVKK